MYALIVVRPLARMPRIDSFLVEKKAFEEKADIGKC
jgi:hypothetical protein